MNYCIINTSDDFNKAIKALDTASLVAYDTETTGINVRQDRVIGFSFSTNSSSGFYYPLLEWSTEKQELVEVVLEIPKDSYNILLHKLSEKMLIMHNASFDIRVTRNNLKHNLLSALYADTMLMEHTLNEEGPFGLKEISIRDAALLGFSADEVANQEQLDLAEAVKANGGKWLKTQKDIYKGPMRLIGFYAIKDTILTFKLYEKDQKELEKQGLLDFFYELEVMPLCKFVTIPMEHGGVPFDVQTNLRLISEIKADIEAAETNVVIALLATDAGLEFVAKRLEENYPIKPTGSFAQEVVKLFSIPLAQSSNGKYSITKAALNKLQDDNSGISFLKTGDAAYLKASEIEEIRRRLLIADTGTHHPINISSKLQMGQIVFDFMGHEPLSKTDKGSPQFNEEMIEHLAKEYGFAWAKELRVFNKLTKILGSSYQRFADEQENGVFYPYYKQHGTTSGRYSSNIQQLPRPIEHGSDDARIEKYTNTIRKLFVARFGFIFIDDDYASLEPSVFAHDATDEVLINIFKNFEDFYSRVAIMALGLTDCSADKKAPNFLKNLYPKHRQDAKAYSLGIRYGAEAGKISQLLNINKEAAQEIVDNYFKAFPGLKARMDDYKRQAKQTGMVVSEFGRVRHLKRAKQIYDRFGDGILDYQKLRQLSSRHRMSFDELNEIRREYKNLMNNALNFPIQSAATTIINRAMIAMTKEFIEKGIKARVCAVIHDQAIIYVKEEHKEQAAEIVQRCMETTTPLRVPLFAVPQFAKDFQEGH